VLKNRIGLSDEQLAQVQQLREDFEATVDPLFEQGHALRESLRTELESDAPSVETVGNLVISGHDVRNQIRATRQNFKESFEVILTPEQLEKLKGSRERRHRRGFGGRGFRRGPGAF
jgi:Spy/CpxP family protein refolding chaperone